MMVVAGPEVRFQGTQQLARSVLLRVRRRRSLAERLPPQLGDFKLQCEQEQEQEQGACGSCW